MPSGTSNLSGRDQIPRNFPVANTEEVAQGNRWSRGIRPQLLDRSNAASAPGHYRFIMARPAVGEIGPVGVGGPPAQRRPAGPIQPARQPIADDTDYPQARIASRRRRFRDVLEDVKLIYCLLR